MNARLADNIGAGYGFTVIIMNLSDIRDERLYQKLSYSFLFLVIFLQELDPWNLNTMLVPIFLCFAICITIKFCQRRLPTFNTNVFFKALALLFASMYLFFKAIDDHADYLRFYHGIWHIVISTCLFYAYQCHLPDSQLLYFQDVSIFNFRDKYQPIKQQPVF